jgi:50S ribosomal subunit-associated GTPase HflX
MNAVKILVANKTDRAAQRAVSKEEGQSLAEKYGAVAFIETSAKTKDHASDLFNRLIDEVLANPDVLDPSKAEIRRKDVVNVASTDGAGASSYGCNC